MMRAPEASMIIAAVFVSTAAAAAPPAAGYSADPQQSRLEFVGVQAGAEFKGTFHKFTAAVDFAPEALESSHFDVVIDLNSEDSMDKDRDTAIRGADIFDVAHWPTAHYVTRGFTKTSTGYTAAGSLTLRGVTKDVPVDSNSPKPPAARNSRAAPSSSAWIFGAGQGDWKTTEWVADAVKISFSLVLKPRS